MNGYSLQVPIPPVLLEVRHKLIQIDRDGTFVVEEVRSHNVFAPVSQLMLLFIVQNSLAQPSYDLVDRYHVESARPVGCVGHEFQPIDKLDELVKQMLWHRGLARRGREEAVHRRRNSQARCRTLENTLACPSRCDITLSTIYGGLD